MEKVKEIVLGVILAAMLILMALVLITCLFACSANASEYDIDNRYGGRSDYEVRTNDNYNYTINERHGGREVGSFSVPQPRNDSYDMRYRTPTKDDPRTIVLPPLGGWK